MKVLTQVCRILVGVLFIFSGLVKANDPSGLSYKMQEFFDLWGWSALNTMALGFSVFMIAFEIIAGAALLLGWKPKLISWLLLLLIVFFTFLTGYAYLSGKFRSCGCFGDCIPITSKVSFLKDVVLLVLVLFLFCNRRYIRPVFAKGVTAVLLLLSTVFSFGSQWYALKHLPFKDCLPYKVGNNIPGQMKMPANAVPDSTEIRFVYEKNGKKMEFTAENFPADFDESTYKFISRYDKMIRPGSNNVPPINNFVLLDTAKKNHADEILAQPYVLLLMIEHYKGSINEWQQDFAAIYKDAVTKNIPVFLVTSTRLDLVPAISGTAFKDIPILDGDNVMIRTAVRANPTVMLLKQGTILGKWSDADFGKGLKAVNQLTDHR